MKSGMSIGARLELRQSQSLVMTPQLQQAIKLLQLSNLELASYVEQELERNPLLELAGENDGADGSAERSPENEASAEAAPEPAKAAVEDSYAGVEGASAGSDLDADFSNYYDESGSSSNVESGANIAGSDAFWQERRGGADGVGAGDLLEATAALPQTLLSHLQDQLALAGLDASDRLIGAHLIDLIDETGYFRGDVAEVADRLGTEPDKVEEILKLIQSFEPAGVGARDLAECLSLQLKELGRLDPAMQACLANLDLVAKRSFDRLAKLCGVSVEDVSDMLCEIRACQPKPGLRFGSDPITPIVADVIVSPAPDGSWRVELNSETLPRLLVARQYHALVSPKLSSQKDKAYLSECLVNANWLVKSLDQRARTIMKVASEIVRLQDAFLQHGVQHLRPLNLRTVAEAIGMHESTVSRVTSHKYIATPRGLFELKYFFTSAISGTDAGAAHSAEAVRHRIKMLIDAEAPDRVLSDDNLVETLRGEGIDIARRTVAKYREALGIPSSVQRRREKKALA